MLLCEVVLLIIFLSVFFTQGFIESLPWGITWIVLFIERLDFKIDQLAKTVAVLKRDHDRSA